MAYKFQVGAANLSGALEQTGLIDSVADGSGNAGYKVGGLSVIDSSRNGDFNGVKVASGQALGAGSDPDMMTLTQATSIVVASDLDFEIAGAGKLKYAGTAVTADAGELNLLENAVANTVVNSKAVIYGGSGQLAGTLSTVAQPNVTSVGTLTALQVDNINLNGSAIVGSTANDLTIDVTDGQAVVVEGVSIDDGVITGASSVTSTAFVGTLSTAAQTNVTSLGTLTALQVDNLNLNGNTLSSTAGTDLLITPLAGQQIVLDGTIVIDAGIVTGATSITSTDLIGTNVDGILGADTARAATVTTLTANTSVIPDSAGGADLGSTGAEWGDVYIADDKKLQFGNDQDASIEYDANGTSELRIAGAALTVEQAATFDGAVTLGNATADAITVLGNSTFAGTTIANLGTVQAATSITSTNLVGAIDGVLGGVTPAAATATTLTATGNITATGAGIDTYTLAADHLYFRDADDGFMQRTTWKALADLVGGTGIAVDANGVFSVDTTGGDSMSVSASVSGHTAVPGLNYFGTIAAATTLVMPTAATDGDIYVIKLGNVTSDELTISTYADQKIDGLDTLEMESPYGSITLIANASGSFRLV